MNYDKRIIDTFYREGIWAKVVFGIWNDEKLWLDDLNIDFDRIIPMVNSYYVYIPEFKTGLQFFETLDVMNHQFAKKNLNLDVPEGFYRDAHVAFFKRDLEDLLDSLAPLQRHTEFYLYPRIDSRYQKNATHLGTCGIKFTLDRLEQLEKKSNVPDIHKLSASYN